MSSKYLRIVLFGLLAAAGIWILARPVANLRENAARQSAVGALAPAGAGNSSEPVDSFSQNALVAPVSVNMRDIPAGVYDADNQFDRWQLGEIDLDEQESIVSAARMAELRAEALTLSPSDNIDLATENLSGAPAAGVAFDSIDYNECCGGGGNVPPDPELAVGPNYVIAVVNVAFEIYNKSGVSLVGPTTFSSFMNSNSNCTGVFDPNVLYDESADRYLLGIDADGSYYCLAVSQSGDPLAGWNIYAFNTATGSDFFDYPHVGVGRDAIYMGGNIFGAVSFKEARVWAFNKTAMYNGQSAASVSRAFATTEDTPQPLNLHGWNQNTWPTSGPHYIFTETNYNGATYKVTSWNDPFGANTFTTVGTVNLNTATGVTAGMPVDVPQSGGQTLQANDFRPQDFEYRNGYAWSVQTIACNPGGGTVDCIRWAQINPATASVVNAGVYGSSSQYRFFGDLAVNHCNDMAVGYTKSSSSMFPGVWYTGRLSSDPAGTLQAEAQLKAGEIAYTSFETSAPRRWGDYTEMTIDPNGDTFWYLGEYSKNTGTTQGRWGTYIGSFSYSCSTGGATATPVATQPPPTATNTPGPQTCTTYSSTDTPINMPNGVTSISSTINVGNSATIADVNVSVNMPHAWVGDLIFSVSKGTGNAAIIDQPGAPATTYGCSGDNILATLDDEAALPVENQCAGSVPTINGTFSPNNPLSVFDGGSANGNWTLTVVDTYPSADAGSLSGWSVEICTEGVPPTATPIPPTATNTAIPPTPTNTSVPPTATNTSVPPTATNTSVPPSPTNTPIPPTVTSVPPTATPLPPGTDIIYVSSTSGGNVGGVSFADEDILAYNTGTGTWAMFFDGSDVGLSASSSQDVDAVHILPDGTVLLSFVGPTSVPGVGSVDDSDIVRFVPTSTGTNTAGSFEWYFDGSDVGLTTNGEDVDAVGLLSDGTLLISTTGGYSVSGASGADEDLIRFVPTSLGATTAGSFAVYFDGSDVGLNNSGSEDTTGAWAATLNGDIYLTSLGSFSVSGLSGDGADIYICSPGSLGAFTSCTFTMFWDGSTFGFGSEAMDGFSITN